MDSKSTPETTLLDAFDPLVDTFADTIAPSADVQASLYTLMYMTASFDHSFGHALRQRRDELGLTKEAVADRGGPRSTTLSKLESNLVTSPRPTTFQALDQALSWPAGTAARLFHTGRRPPDQAKDSSPSPGIQIRETELTDLITWNTLLAAHVRDRDDQTALSYTEHITQVTNRLLGRWIDRVIDDNDQVALGFLTNILASQPMVPPEHPDYLNQLYRRWRLGIITDEQVSPPLLATFRSRRADDAEES